MSCAVCGGTARAVIELPGFIGGAQALLQCDSCGHGMLKVAHPQKCGYASGGTEYSRRGVEWFLAHIEGGYKCALDFGCNDGHLLRGVRAQRRIGVDLSAPALEFETHSSLDTVDAAPDLIVSRHTFEHLADPVGTLKALVRMAAPTATFAIEVPDFGALAEELRFDQVYNEHLQYFSRRSFLQMLNAAGLVCHELSHNRNPHSMLALCGTHGYEVMAWTIPRIEERYAAFHTYTLAAGNAFMCAPQRVAYGASSVFKVLLYHLGLDPSAFEAVVDDARRGAFHGLPLVERVPTGATVLISAPDSFREIYRKCDGARGVVSAVPMV